MNPIFIDAINKKFANQFTMETINDCLFIRFPPKCPDFGSVDICEHTPGSYIVYVGNFTHSHFDLYDGTHDEIAKEAAEDVCDFLEDLFADCIICFGAHEKGGGFYRKGFQGVTDEEYDWADLFVWSGLYRAKKIINQSC